MILHVQVDAWNAVYYPDFAASQHVPLPTAVVGLGPVPAGGTLDVPIAVPLMPPGHLSSRFVGQALFVGAGGVFDAGPSTLLIVDAAL